MNTSILRRSGLLAIIVQLSTLLVASIYTHLNWLGSQSISSMGTTSIAPLYRAGFLVGAFFLIGFMLYVKQAYDVDNWFISIFMIGIASEALLGIVPLTVGGRVVIIHQVMGIILLISILLVLRFFSTNSLTSQPLKIRSIILFWVYVGVVLFGVVAVSLGYLFALSELLALLVFDGWIVSISIAGIPDAHG